MRLRSYFETAKKRKNARLVFLLLGALLCGLCLVTQRLDLLEWVSLVPMAIALYDVAEDETIRKRDAYGYGFFFYFCFYAVNFHWFVNLYPLDFVEGMTKPSALAVVLLGCFGLSALQALGAGVAFVLFVCLSRGAFFKNSIILKSLFAAAVWTVLEWSQTIGWVGVPWARLAIGQTGLLVGAQSSSLFGCCFVTFLVVLVNFLVAGAILYTDKRKALALLAALTVVFNFSLGALLYVRNTKNDAPVVVAAIQGNVSSADKWDFTKRWLTLEVYEKYTVKAAEDGADIVIWPESALPYNITYDIELLNYISRLARENEVTLLVGAFTYEGDDEYNTIVTVLSDGSLHETKYYKRHLVPFGEYVPYRQVIEVVLPVLADLGMLPYDLAAGDSASVIELDGASIGSLICFDSIYDELARDSARAGADIFAVSTNDSWFLDSAALRMHNAQAMLRSIENGRYTVRAANTGISSVIAPNGTIEKELGALKEGYVLSEVYPQEKTTLYTHIGNTFVYACIAWIIVCFVGNIFELKRQKSIDINEIK